MPDKPNGNDPAGSTPPAKPAGTLHSFTPTNELPPFKPPLFDGISSQALADRLEHIKKLDSTQYFSVIAKNAGVEFPTLRKSETSCQRFSRWKNAATHKMALLGKQNFDRLATYIAGSFSRYAHHLDVPQDQLLANPLYHGLAPLLNLRTRQAHRLAQDQLVGSYRTYRPSRRQSNFVYIGHMDIAYDEYSNGFTLRERYARSRDEQWDMLGTPLPLSSEFFILLTANPENNTVHLKYINKVRRANNVLTGFSGWMSHTFSSKFYCCPFRAEKILPLPDQAPDVPCPKPMLSYLPLTQLDQTIQDELTQELERRPFDCLHYET